jgi:putative ABC transport system permease protein
VRDALRRDLRHAWRRLILDRTFSIIAGATLAIGIGATTALYSVLDSALLRPLPFRDAEELVYVWGTWGPERQIRGASYPEAMDWRESARSVAEFSIYDETTLTMARPGGPARQIEAEVVSPGFFEMLGVGAVLGRGLLPEDDVPNSAAVVVIGDGLWRSEFGASRDIVGQTVHFDGRPFTIAGVMPPGFLGLSFDTEAWTSLAATYPDNINDRGQRWLAAVARVAPGFTVAAAQNDMDRVTSLLEQRYPEINEQRSARLIPLREAYLESTGSLILILFAAVSFLLLIACVNVTNLQVVRGLARTPELSLRSALGAGRLKLVRQLLVEGVVVALAGAVFGTLMAFWGLDALLSAVPQGALPPFVQASMNLRAIGFAVLVALLCGALATLAPALKITSGQLARNLVSGSRVAVSVAGTGKRVGLQHVLVTIECALAVVVLIGAGLLVRSFRELATVDTGFAARAIVAARVDLPAVSYDSLGRLRVAETIQRELLERPGIIDVQVTSDAPLRGWESAAILQREGFDRDRIRYYRHSVTPGYFAMLEISRIAGRGFTEYDRPDTDPVVIVSRTMAARLWPAEDPVGKRILLDNTGALYSVVGVVDDVRQRQIRTTPGDPTEDPDIYFPLAQRPVASFELLVRASERPAQTLAVLRDVAANVDASLALYNTETLEEALRRQTATDRFGSLLLAVFAVLSLVLASVGIYGVMAFFVGQRRREMAIRMAFGASPGAVGLLILRHGATILVAGAVAGTILAGIATRVLAAFLFNVRPIDPATFGIALLVMILAGLAAVHVPARRAIRSSPSLALGAE